MQQIAHEFAKFAPGLTTCMYYGGRANKAAAGDMDSVDVLITTPHKIHEVEIPRNVHRLVLDEGHLLDSGSTQAPRPRPNADADPDADPQPSAHP